MKRVTIEVADGIAQLPKAGQVVTGQARGFGESEFIGTVVKVEDVPTPLKPCPHTYKVSILASTASKAMCVACGERFDL